MPELFCPEKCQFHSRKLEKLDPRSKFERDFLLTLYSIDTHFDTSTTDGF